jgi:hypothetical protein
MWKDMNALTGDMRRRRIFILAVVAGMGAFLVSYVFAVLDIRDVLRTGLVSDVGAYGDLAESVLNGEVPYLDFPFEHLPSMLIPVVGLGWLSQITGVSLWLVWPMAMTAVFAATAVLVDRIDTERPAGFLFIVVSLPLLPLALFRLEPWVVLIATGAIVAFLAGRNAVGAGLTVLGSLAKGWPIAISALPWKLGQKSVAVLTAAGAGVGLVAVLIQEGFRTGRDFEGIHTETVVGSLLLLARHGSGVAIDTFGSAGARYVSAPTWALALNAIPGLVVLAIAAFVLRRPLTRRAIVSVVGLTVLGILLVSPLFSTQFLVWLAPFVAGLSSRNRWLYAISGMFALASVAVFDHTSVVWTVDVAASNIMVLALAAAWSRDLVIDTRSTQESSTSLRNLPV